MNRIVWIDFLKGFSIMWLVVYHFYVFDWLMSPVPVFFFLSGLFYSDRQSFKLFVLKKSKALLIPFLFFYVIGVLPLVVGKLARGEMYDFSRLLAFFTLIPIDADIHNPIGVGAIWFLLSLFEIYVIYYLLRRISTNKVWLVVASVAALLVYSGLSSYYAMGSWFYLIYSLNFLIYFTMGNILKQMVINSDIPQKREFYITAFLAFSIVLLPTKGIVDVFCDKIWHFGQIWLLIAVFQRFTLCCQAKGKYLLEFFSYEGRNSLTILGTHFTILGGAKIVLKTFLPEGICLYVLLLFITIVLCNMCIYIFNRYCPSFVNHRP